MTWAELERAAQRRQLLILGGFHPVDDPALNGIETLILLGPDEPAFWPALKASPEWQTADPVDRWSQRVIGTWAKQIGAQAFYPFGGPPWHPFLAWAQKTGRIHQSPSGMLVHDRAGLFLSFRGALGFRTRLDLPAPPTSPCTTCDGQPCKSACPVNALKGDHYLVNACKDHLNAPEGADCTTKGCRARRACPVSQTWGRLPEQSAYHMQRFRRG